MVKAKHFLFTYFTKMVISDWVVLSIIPQKHLKNISAWLISMKKYKLCFYISKPTKWLLITDKFNVLIQNSTIPEKI